MLRNHYKYEIQGPDQYFNPECSGKTYETVHKLTPDHLPKKIMSANRVILEQNPETYHKILSEIHDSPIREDIQASPTHGDLVNRRYEGPGLRKYTEDYVKGCAKCQESKVISNRKRTPTLSFLTHMWNKDRSNTSPVGSLSPIYHPQTSMIPS